MKANEVTLPTVEALGDSEDGWIRILFPDGREDTYCSPATAGSRQLGNIAFTGDAALIRCDSDGTLSDWAAVGGKNLQYRGDALPSARG